MKKSINSNKKNNNKNNKISIFKKINFMWIYPFIFVMIIVIQIFNIKNSPIRITAQKFYTILKSNDIEKIIAYKENELYKVDVYIKQLNLTKEQHKFVKSSTFGDNKGPHYYFNISSYDNFYYNVHEIQKNYSINDIIDPILEQQNNIINNILLTWVLPICIFIIIWMFLIRKLTGNSGTPGSHIFNIGKSKATLFDKESNMKITFNDVAGLEEPKQEVMEIVDFLKNPKKYTNLGGKIPKGVLLVGYPGTGKTLLAKAVAGEAKVPFFSISGSDFVEMFVGVGASRVRDLFKQAKAKAPCIIFIDEIDAIGRTRGKNHILGGNDERENTLNQLLVEMDGFGTDSCVIIMAATNRPDVLDCALLRPGRFDRQISIDKPDINERESIFKVHLKPLKLIKNVNYAKQMAAQTPGFAGAEIANICNESALIAARNNKKKIDISDLNAAIDRIIGGLEKKNKIISPEEKRIIAYHESGHAIVGWYLKYAHPLVKVSIIPRGIAALGYAQYLPKEKYLYTTNQLMDNMCMTLGGRAAEKIIFNQISTGAQNDLERITKLAYAMVTLYGMNDIIGNISYSDKNKESTFNKPYSEKTSEIIDKEVRLIVKKAYNIALNLLEEKFNKLQSLAENLLKKEVLMEEEIKKILGSHIE